MKALTKLIFFSLIFTSCRLDNRSDIDTMMDNARENFKKEGKKINAKNREWDSVINNIYETSEYDENLAYRKVDYIISNNPQLDQFEIETLHFVKGKILLKNDSLNAAIDEFAQSGIKHPKTLAARAQVFLKLKDYKNCLKDLKYAANINSEFQWNIGNYYEVVNKKDSAIIFYKKLFLKDSIIYKYSGDRIKELKDDKTELYKELQLIENKNLRIVWGE